MSKKTQPAKKPRKIITVESCKHDNETFEELLERYEIHTWDWILIGDGSGSNFDTAAGWGCVAIDRLKFEKTVWWGSMNRGTVNIAEMMAYIAPLSWIASVEDRRRKARKRRARQVHILTDSDYCRRQGNSDNLMPNKNGALWRVFDDFQRHGLVLNWHHAYRNDVALNSYVDAISKESRQVALHVDVQRRIERGVGAARTVHDFNPFDNEEAEEQTGDSLD